MYSGCFGGHDSVTVASSWAGCIGSIRPITMTHRVVNTCTEFTISQVAISVEPFKQF